MAAQMALGDLPLERLFEEFVIDPEEDEATGLARAAHDAIFVLADGLSAIVLERRAHAGALDDRREDLAAVGGATEGGCPCLPRTFGHGTRQPRRWRHSVVSTLDRPRGSRITTPS